jgi:hypothetical protein
MNDIENNPWRKGIAQDVASQLGPPPGTVFYEHNRKPFGKKDSSHVLRTHGKAKLGKSKMGKSGKKKGPFFGKF